VSGAGMSVPVATATAATLADGGDGIGGTPGMAEIPLAVVSSDDVDMSGTDFSIKAFLNDRWTASASASFVSDDYFAVDDGEVKGGINSIALNAPKTKGSFALAYRDAHAGFNAEARLRMTVGFPAESAGFCGDGVCDRVDGRLLRGAVRGGFPTRRLYVGLQNPKKSGDVPDFGEQSVRLGVSQLCRCARGWPAPYGPGPLRPFLERNQAFPWRVMEPNFF